MKNQNLKISIIASAVLSCFSFGVMAETPSFNFVEIGYTQLDIDGTSAEPDGFEFDYNYLFSDNFYLSADYAKVDDSGVDLKMTNLGFGYKSDISNNTAFFAQLDWSKFEIEDFDDDGYKASLGLRSSLTKNLEVTAAYEYLDIDDESNDFYVLGAAYQMNDKFAIYADYKTESDFDQISLGLRMDF